MQTAVADAASRDSDIAELLAAGRRERAFELLLQRYESKIYRLCCALLRDRAQAEDAAQESLVRIWKALERFDGRASLSSWIYAISRNRCLTAIERRRSTQAVSEQELGAEMVETAADEAEPESDRSAQLRQMLELLPERQRQALTLYYFEERSTSEVALMLGCPEGTVKTHLFRARAALTGHLRRHGLYDPRLWLEGP